MVIEVWREVNSFGHPPSQSARIVITPHVAIHWLRLRTPHSDQASAVLTTTYTTALISSFSKHATLGTWGIRRRNQEAGWWKCVAAGTLEVNFNPRGDEQANQQSTEVTTAYCIKRCDRWGTYGVAARES